MTAVKSGSRRRGRRPLHRGADTGPGVDLHHDTGQEHPAQDWSAIAVGSTVSVIPPAGLPYYARVDAKTPDSGIVWVVSLDGSGRQMHGNRDGVSLLPAAGGAVMTAVLVLGAFGMLPTAGVLWAAAPLLQPAPGRGPGEAGYTAVGVGLTINS